MASTNLRASIEATFRSLLGAYKEGGETQDTSVINRDLTPDCTRHLLPKSMLEDLGAPTDWVIDNAEYERQFASDLKTGRTTHMEINNLIIDTETRKAAATTVTDVTYHDGEVIRIEHSWIISFNEDGSKATKLVEFVDIIGVRKMVAKAGGGTPTALTDSTA